MNTKEITVPIYNESEVYDRRFIIRDWTTIVASCVPAAIAGVLSYITARHKGKTTSEKLRKITRQIFKG